MKKKCLKREKGLAFEMGKIGWPRRDISTKENSKRRG